MVMRPKSSATVVVVLPLTPSRSSTPTLAWVRYSSVRSGATSLTAPTMVVFPTPNPPGTSIFTASGASSPRSEFAKPIPHRHQHRNVGDAARLPGGQPRPRQHLTRLDEITKEDHSHR